MNQANLESKFQLACQVGFLRVPRCNLYTNYDALLPLTFPSVQSLTLAETLCDYCKKNAGQLVKKWDLDQRKVLKGSMQYKLKNMWELYHEYQETNHYVPWICLLLASAQGSSN